MTENQAIPDFSGDDFANDKEIQRIRAAVKAHEKMVEEAFSLFRRELQVQDTSPVDLGHFHLLQESDAAVVKELGTADRNPELRIFLVKYSSAFPIPRLPNAGTDEYLFGHLTTRKRFPRTYVHRETIKEKIEDLFLQRDVDFPHSKRFSRKFQVVTADKEALQALLSFIELDELADFPELEMEFHDNTLLFRHSRKSVSPEEANAFCTLSKVLLSLFH